MKKILVSAALALMTAGTTAANAMTPKTLHSFCTHANCNEGSKPWGAPVTDGNGNWYGAASFGGAASNEGAVYQMSFNGTKWVYKRIHAFCTRNGCPDGGLPRGELIVDTSGNLYGMTNEGGANGSGVVYELSPGMTGWTIKVLHSFCRQTSCTDGSRPSYGGLSYQGQSSGALYDGVSPLYGTTLNGGANAQGTVFSLTPGMTNNWTHRVIHDFCSLTNCTDGAQSYSAITVDTMGNLFGMSTLGGDYHHGVVFELSKHTNVWKETVLHSFCAGGGFCADGDDAMGPLLIDGMGNLIGTTYFGGAHGKGSVFSIAPNGTHSTLTTLYSFCTTTGCPDGSHPQSGVMMDADGHLLGATYDGGAANTGTIFKLAGTQHDQFTSLYAFGNGIGGQYMVSGLSADASGALFGTAIIGGAKDLGVFFKIGQ